MEVENDFVKQFVEYKLSWMLNVFEIFTNVHKQHVLEMTGAACTSSEVYLKPFIRISCTKQSWRHLHFAQVLLGVGKMGNSYVALN